MEEGRVQQDAAAAPVSQGMCAVLCTFGPASTGPKSHEQTLILNECCGQTIVSTAQSFFRENTPLLIIASNIEALKVTTTTSRQKEKSLNNFICRQHSWKFI